MKAQTAKRKAQSGTTPKNKPTTPESDSAVALRSTVYRSTAPEPDDVLRMYLAEATKHELLTPEQEQQLTRAISQGRTAATRLQAETLQEQAREALTQQVRAGKAARSTLIRHNLRLVIPIAARHAGRGVPLIDLIQEGNLGLFKAANKFNPALGNRFSTYATWWIRRDVQHAVANLGRIVRLPVYLHSRLAKLLAAADQLAQEIGRTPTPEELAEHLQLSVAHVVALQAKFRHTQSLDEPLGPEQATLADFLPADGALEEEVLARTNAARLPELLEHLDARAARVLMLRFGLRGGPEHTLEEVGQKYGYTREYIRQIEKDALRTLRTLLCQPKRLSG